MSWLTESILIFIVGTVLAIPLSMVANILTPRFLNWRASRSKLSAERRINYLRFKLSQTEKLSASTKLHFESFVNDIFQLIAQLIQIIFTMFFLLRFAADSAYWLYNVFFFVFLANYCFCAFLANHFYYKHNRVYNFEKYKTKINSQIAALDEIIDKKSDPD